MRVNRADRGRSENSCWPVAALLGLLAWSAGTWAVLPASAQSPIANTPNASGAAPAASGRLQTLVRETAVQFQIAYRRDAAEQVRHREQLAAAVAAWRAAARGEANDRLLSEWLRAAIRASMPGSREPLPPLPKFAQTPVATPTATPSTSTKTLRQKPVVGNLGASPAKALSGQSSTERSMIGGSAAGPAEAAPQSSTVGAADHSKSEQDFWSAHPANGDLPAELSGGDPFRDDPPPVEE